MEASAVQHARSSAQTRCVSPGRRLLAWLFDCVIVGFLLIPLNPLLYTDEPDAALFFGLTVAGTILVDPYLVAFDGGKRGATPGKRIVGIRVADAGSRRSDRIPACGDCDPRKLVRTPALLLRRPTEMCVGPTLASGRDDLRRKAIARRSSRMTRAGCISTPATLDA